MITSHRTPNTVRRVAALLVLCLVAAGILTVTVGPAVAAPHRNHEHQYAASKHQHQTKKHQKKSMKKSTKRSQTKRAPKKTSVKHHRHSGRHGAGRGPQRRHGAKPNNAKRRGPSVSRAGGRDAHADDAPRAVRALAEAASKSGAPYVYGAAGPAAFDCSGLVQWAFAQVGVSLPRTSAAQAAATTRVAAPIVGDLVFFHNAGSVYHVGIYAGGGQVVHASKPGVPLGKARIWTSSVFYGRVR